MTSIPPSHAEAEAKAKMDRAFASGEIWSCTEKELISFLNHLNEEGILNERVQHRAIIRALTINHIQMQRILEAQDRANFKIQIWFMALTVIGLLLSFAALFHG